MVVHCVVMINVSICVSNLCSIHLTLMRLPVSVNEVCDIAKILSTCPYNIKTSATTINYFTIWSLVAIMVEAGNTVIR